MDQKKLISVVTPCYNEEENVEEVYAQVKAVFSDLPQYRYEHIFIDNASTDSTVAVLKKLAAVDYNVKIIVNIKNFGWIRSPHYGLLQAHGYAVVLIVADLQDPPALIKEFIKEMAHRLEAALDAGWQDSSKREEFLKEAKRTLQELILKDYRDKIKVSDFQKYLNRLIDVVIRKF